MDKDVLWTRGGFLGSLLAHKSAITWICLSRLFWSEGYCPITQACAQTTGGNMCTETEARLILGRDSFDHLANNNQRWGIYFLS